MKTKSYLISGVANEHSLSWEVARQLLDGGSRCFLPCLPANQKRVARLAAPYSERALVLPTDVTSSEDCERLMVEVGTHADRLTGVLHSIAFCAVEELQAGTLATSRVGFLQAMDVSVYSLIALTRAVRRFLHEGSSVVTLSHYGAQKCVPGYNIMGVAKAALESLVRYLAYELGEAGIRVNSVSAGAVLTLSSSVFEDIEEKIAAGIRNSPLRRGTTQTDVAAAVLYLFGPQAQAITGQCIFVDNGLSSMGAM